MNLDNFFAELKRRNVYKVAVAYAVVGWLLVQVATQVFPFFEIPNWAVRSDRADDRARISDCARHRLGVRTDAGRTETNGRCRSYAQGTPEIPRVDLRCDRGRGVFDRLVFSRSLYGPEYR